MAGKVPGIQTMFGSCTYLKQQKNRGKKEGNDALLSKKGKNLTKSEDGILEKCD